MWTVFASLGVILSACYMLWLYQRTFYGKASESVTHHMPDLTAREWALISCRCWSLMVRMGSFAQTFLPAISASGLRRFWNRPRRWKCSGSLYRSSRYPRAGRGCTVLSSFAPSAIDYLRFLPEIILTLTGVLIMFLEAILPTDKKHVLGAAQRWLD